MHLATFTLLEPRADEVLVCVAAASINLLDWKIRNGDLKIFTGSKFSRAMGKDFAGTVEAVGSTVSDLKPGDAVLGTVSMRRSEAFAPRLITTRYPLVKKPDKLSFAEAATYELSNLATLRAWPVRLVLVDIAWGTALTAAAAAAGRWALGRMA